ETDVASQERLASLEQDLADLSEEIDALSARWNREKEAIAEIRRIKAEMEEARAAAEIAERDGDLARAAELRYGTLIELGMQLKEKEADLARIHEQGSLLSEEVIEQDVAEV